MRSDGGVHGDTTLIAGPTASGKTALAVALARESGAAIVNADSMQVYDVLYRLTARPNDDELAAAPHHLFGHVPPSQTYSTGQWLRDVQDLLSGPLANRPVIFVGGTGLYFRALEGGLSEMPAVPDAIRESWRVRLKEEGPETLHSQLDEIDPLAAAAIGARDGQRIVRALEIFEATGVPLSEHQKKKGPSLLEPARTRRIVMLPEREWLRQRIADRFRIMISEGAIEEVRHLLSLDLDASLPAMKAIGVRPIAALLKNELSQEEAVEQSIHATRQYAKRQQTWFRTQLGDNWQRFDTLEELV
ncbi:tRNA (adenosine(37)-N6)-dimethylallyltransferase MiaA [Notoacmeibacter ruber]